MARRNPHLQPQSARHLDVYRVSLEYLELLAKTLPRWRRFSRGTEAQLKEALASSIQNLAEAMRRTGADRAHLLTVSMGSTDESMAIIDAGLAFGVIEADEHRKAAELADRIGAMTYRLRQRCS